MPVGTLKATNVKRNYSYDLVENLPLIYLIACVYDIITNGMEWVRDYISKCNLVLSADLILFYYYPKSRMKYLKEKNAKNNILG